MIRTALKMAAVAALGWLSHEFTRRGRGLHGLRRVIARQQAVIQQGGILNQALREELASRKAESPERVLDVPIGEALPDTVTIGLAQFEGYTEGEWEAWREAVVATIRGLVARRLEHRAGQEVARLEAMARGVGPDAAPAEPTCACPGPEYERVVHRPDCPVRAGAS